jgi:hypothetical protein
LKQLPNGKNIFARKKQQRLKLENWPYLQLPQVEEVKSFQHSKLVIMLYTQGLKLFKEDAFKKTPFSS